MADLNWDTMAERRRKHRLILFFKMKNGISPEYLTHLISQPQAQPYALRNRADVPVITCNTQSHASSFLLRTIRQWNSLPENIRNTPTLGEFKSKLNTKSKKPQLLYNVGNRQDNHARLRLGCSSLNYDLHRRNIIPSSLCPQRFTLCTYSRKSPFRKWSTYTRCKFKRFLKSPGIHCRINAFWRLTNDSHWCVDIYTSGRRVRQITFAWFFLFLF